MNSESNFRVLHFVYDEKFIPLVQLLYQEVFPDRNEYRCLTNSPGQYRFVRPDSSVISVEEGYFSSDRLLLDFQACDCLVVHSMLPAFAIGVRRAPEDKLVVWSGWGFDYYGILEAQIGSLRLPETVEACRRLRMRARMRNIINPKRVLARIRTALGASHASGSRPSCGESLRAAAGRIDIFSVNPSEEGMIRDALPEMRGGFHFLSYYTTEDTLEKGPERMDGPDVLVGNSASPENNHLEAFSMLRKADLAGRKIVVPLSYGTSEAYCEMVCSAGRRIFGDMFEPLRKFMPLAEYNWRLKNCGRVLMNHVRQQAVGNINAALYKGAVLFLRKENPLFRFYGELGAQFYSVDDLRIQLNGLSTPPILSALYDRNHGVIGKFWSRANALAGIRDLYRLHRMKMAGMRD